MKAAHAGTLLVAVAVAVNAMTTFAGGPPRKFETHLGAALGWVGFQAACSLALVAGAARIRSRGRLGLAATLVGVHGALMFVGTSIALAVGGTGYPAIVAVGHAAYGATVLFALGAFVYAFTGAASSRRSPTS